MILPWFPLLPTAPLSPPLSLLTSLFATPPFLDRRSCLSLSSSSEPIFPLSRHVSSRWPDDWESNPDRQFFQGQVIFNTPLWWRDRRNEMLQRWLLVAFCALVVVAHPQASGHMAPAGAAQSGRYPLVARLGSLDVGGWGGIRGSAGEGSAGLLLGSPIGSSRSAVVVSNIVLSSTASSVAVLKIGRNPVCMRSILMPTPRSRLLALHSPHLPPDPRAASSCRNLLLTPATTSTGTSADS